MEEEKNLVAEVEEMTREQFDTIEGFEAAINDGCLCSLNDIIENRKIFAMMHGPDKLRGFVIFGEYIFSADGSVKSIFKGDREHKDVQLLIDFLHESGNGYSTENHHVIPTKEQCCKYCGEEFMAFDLRDNPCQRADDGEKFYHVTCAQKSAN